MRQSAVAGAGSRGLAGSRAAHPAPAQRSSAARTLGTSNTDGLRPGVLLGDDNARRLVSGERGRDLRERVCTGSEAMRLRVHGRACMWRTRMLAAGPKESLPELAHLHAAVLLEDDKVAQLGEPAPAGGHEDGRDSREGSKASRSWAGWAGGCAAFPRCARTSAGA